MSSVKLIAWCFGAPPARCHAANSEYWTSLLASICASKKLETNVWFRLLALLPFAPAVMPCVWRVGFSTEARLSNLQAQPVLPGPTDAPMSLQAVEVGQLCSVPTSCLLRKS